MSKALQKYGALEGKSGPLKKLISNLAGNNYHVFPVPGISMLMARGFDPVQSGISIAPTPRHANVLLVAPPVPPHLCRYAAVAYAQMPRPRMLVFVDIDKADPLPMPDLSLTSADFARFTSVIRHVNFWSQNVTSYEPEHIVEALKMMENGSHKSHQHGHDGGHGGEHIDENDHQRHTGEDNSHHGDQHDEHENKPEENDESEKDRHHHHRHRQEQHQKARGYQNRAKQDGKKEGKNGHEEEHGHKNHEGHGEGGGHHEHEGHGGMGFMSMVEMTKDMPRSMDGLPMEMNETRFGPFFPGLPDGMRLKIMLDGDTVMKAEYEPGLLCRHLQHHYPVDPGELPNHLKGLNPLTPKTYHTLVRKALRANTSGNYPVPVAELEKERIIVHLFWFYHLFTILGDSDLQYRTIRLIRTIYDHSGFDPSWNGKVASFTQTIDKRVYLRNRLRKISCIPEEHLIHLSGPVVKAAGNEQDYRMNDPGYKGFKPVTSDENNAWGQLRVRLGEIGQSMMLMADNKNGHEMPDDGMNFDGGTFSGKSCLETPSGTACLDVSIREGKLGSFGLHLPAVSLAALAPELTSGLELSDALLTITTLGFSPWELES